MASLLLTQMLPRKETSSKHGVSMSARHRGFAGGRDSIFWPKLLVAHFHLGGRRTAAATSIELGTQHGLWGPPAQIELPPAIVATRVPNRHRRGGKSLLLPRRRVQKMVRGRPKLGSIVRERTAKPLARRVSKNLYTRTREWHVRPCRLSCFSCLRKARSS